MGANAFLTLVAGGNMWSVSCSGRIIAKKIGPGIRWLQQCVVPGVGLDVVAEMKLPSLP